MAMEPERDLAQSSGFACLRQQMVEATTSRAARYTCTTLHHPRYWTGPCVGGIDAPWNVRVRLD
jgi:hypothetical protein